MSNYEMPIVVRLSNEELAAALGRPADDPEVRQLGGLNVVLRSIAETANVAAHPSVAEVPGAGDALRGLAEVLQPVEAQLFRRLRSSPALAKRFLLNPSATIAELELLDAATIAKVRSHAQTLAPLFAPPQ